MFYFTDTMKSPILWVRLDALMGLIIWYILFYYPPVDRIKYAWIMAVSFMLATTFTLKGATAFNPVLIDDDGAIITNDTEKN